MRTLWLVPALLSVATASGAGQSTTSGQSGPRSLLPRPREISLARSAAPAALADSATIWVLTERGYEIAVPGSSGAACYVSRSWVESLEPHCYDPEGAAILPIEMRKVELLIEGKSAAEADRQIAEALSAGKYRLPRRPAVSYMMSSAQELIGDDGRKAGHWQPHLMIFFPFLTAAEIGLGPKDSIDATIVVDPGTPLSNLMIVVRKFVDPVPVP